jgi:hypothetical protein
MAGKSFRADQCPQRVVVSIITIKIIILTMLPVVHSVKCNGTMNNRPKMWKEVVVVLLRVSNIICSSTRI